MSMTAATRRSSLRVEALEDRTVPTVTISGQAILADGSVSPASAPPDPGVPNVTIFLDTNANGRLDTGETSTQTNASGDYSFAGIAAGTYNVAAQLPTGMLGFSAQSLAYRLTLPDGATFSNLTFTLTGESQALVRNVFERVLFRPPALEVQTSLAGRLDAGTLNGGQLLASVLASAEFTSTVAPLAKTLAAFFPGQPVDPNLLRANLQLQRAGITPDAAVLNVMYSTKFIAAFGDTSQLSNAAFTTFVYQRLLGRAPTEAEASAWGAALSAGTFNRGQQVLRLVANPQFGPANPDLANRVAVSFAYLGVLGRPADARGFTMYVNYLNRGRTVAQLANLLLASPEAQNSQGFSDLFLSDVQAQQVKPATDVLDRLGRFDPATNGYLPVAAGSLTGFTTGTTPANVYVIAHGWAPGYAQDVSINSTPGNPLKVWQTVQFPGGFDPQGPDSPWLFSGVDQVSAEGLARAIVNVDPNAIVLAYSWIDDSGTAGNGTVGLDNPTPLLLGGQSEGYTQLNGLRLAQALRLAMSSSFFTNKGLLHLLGHSHGSKVATVATLALQQAGVAVSQLTTFESPEAGPTLLGGFRHVPGLIGAQNFLWYYMQQMALSNSPVGADRTPNLTNSVPQTFIDNYFSNVGFGSAFGGFPGLSSLADVKLFSERLYPIPSITDPNFAKDLAAALFDAHDYPPAWYAQASLQTLGTTSANGLNWSPLLNPTTPPASGLYQQTWQSNVFNQQFELSAPGAAPTYIPTFSPLAYASSYTVGQVAENTGSITLGSGGTDALSLLAMTFTPIADSANGPFGTGLDFQVQFANAQAGDQLVFWTRGDVGLTSLFSSEDTGELGYQTIPLFVMDAAAAGATQQGATVSLDLFANNSNALLRGALATTPLPVFGFSLLRTAGSTATVTVSNMRQFSDGTSS